MSVEIIQERLSAYSCQSVEEEELALKEITQEVVLAALSRAEFFREAAFQGGTCLRILHTLDRFSEDLDFILLKPQRHFETGLFLKTVREELSAYGYDLQVQDRAKSDDTVQKMFLKDRSIGKVLRIAAFSEARHRQALSIKLEVDTNPPSGSLFEERYLRFPFPYAVRCQDTPSLFAGKCHALLCRPYVKGRDWYDFIWHVGRKTPVNFRLLTAAIEQQGPWTGKGERVDARWLIRHLKKSIQQIHWDQAIIDMRRFLRPSQLTGLNLWNEKFFLATLRELEDYLPKAG